MPKLSAHTLGLLAFGDRIKRAAIDGWSNALTLIGTGADKATHTRFCPPAPISYEEAEALYNFDDLAYIIIAQLVIDAMGSGFDLKRATDSDDAAKQASEQGAEIVRELKRLGAYDAIKRGRTYGRMSGGGAILLGLEGTGDFSQPVKKTERGVIVGRLRYLRVATRQELTVLRRDDRGEPERYNYAPLTVDGQGNGAAFEVHASRLLIFGGADTTPRMKSANQGWDLSVLDRVWRVMQASHNKWDSVTHMFADMSQAVFKLHGLIDGLASKDSEAIETRVALLDKLRSIARAVVLDAGRAGQPGEEFQLVERSAMTGVDAILDKDLLRLSMAARMPVTIFAGQSPAGMNATGESDRQVWYLQVENERTLSLEPNALTLVGLAAQNLGYDPEGWELCWPPLWQPSEKEQADTAKVKVDTAIALVTAQALQPEEVALALPELGVDIEIDREARRTALALKIEDMKNPPPPPEVPGADPDDPNADPEADPEGDPAQASGRGAQPGDPASEAAAEDDPEAE